MSAASAETDRVRRVWAKHAPTYDERISLMERLFFAGGRAWVASRAAGEVLEIAVGTGRNLAQYSSYVRLTGIDISPEMLAFARCRAETLKVPIELRTGDAQLLDFPNASFDTVVCTLALCSIPDSRRAVFEAMRVLRPGGRFLLLEHVRSPLLPVRLVQRALDWFSVRLEGEHLTREPLEDLEAAGFEIEQVERLKLGIVERVAAKRPVSA